MMTPRYLYITAVIITLSVWGGPGAESTTAGKHTVSNVKVQFAHLTLSSNSVLLTFWGCRRERWQCTRTCLSRYRLICSFVKLELLSSFIGLSGQSRLRYLDPVLILPRNWLIFSVSVLCFMTIPDMRKKLGVTVFVFSETEVENFSFLQALYVFQLQVQRFTKPNRCSKKLYLEFFAKSARTFLIHFSWN